MDHIENAIDKAIRDRTADTGRGVAKAIVGRRPSSGRKAVDDIRYTDTRVLTASEESLHAKRVLTSLTENKVENAYKLLRTQVLQKLKANRWNTLAVTSPTDGGGKTLTAINLAISIARDVNHTVLLVDLSLKNPTIRSYFTSEELPGISDYLIENEIPELLFNPGIERLVVLPGNKPVAGSSEILASPKIADLVNEIKNRYDSRIIIFDMPPVLSSDDVLVFAPYVDATLLVIEDDVTTEAELRRALELLKSTNVIGTVLNRSPVESPSAY